MKSSRMKYASSGVQSMRFLTVIIVFSIVFGATSAAARDLRYDGGEETIYVSPGEPTQVTFPAEIEGGFMNTNTNLTLQKKDNYIVLFANPALRLEGEGIIVQLEDKRTYALRVVPASEEHARDGFINMLDERPPEIDAAEEDLPDFKRNNGISNLMRSMILVAEFGMQKGIPGYRRSNQYSGETVLNDGTLHATIDEIFMGSNLWGYVVNVENLLNTTQQINPATFRLDGTRMVGAERWELAPQPQTTEQKVAAQHLGKVYIITRSKRN